MAITLTVILIYWCQCPRSFIQIKKYYLAIGWLLLTVFNWNVSPQIKVSQSTKSGREKLTFYESRKSNFKFTTEKKIKYAFTPTAKGRLLEVPTKYTLFYKERFFSTQPQCCLTFAMNLASNVARCCLIHISIMILRHFYLLMSRARTIYIVSMWRVYHFHHHYHY